MNFESLVAAIRDLIGSDQRPVAGWSALWPFAHVLDLERNAVAPFVRDAILAAVGDSRTLLMPTFTHGYSDGVLNLDETPGHTGLINESFRTHPETRRTKSAFFSFAVHGPDASELINLRPEHAWGTGSLYEWLEHTGAVCLTLGVHPMLPSYLHRAEWLLADRVPYRFVKRFGGSIIHEGRAEPLTERLFVRYLKPKPMSKFVHLLPFLRDRAELRIGNLSGVRMAAFRADLAMAALLKEMQSDLFLLVGNREEIAEAYGGSESVVTIQ